MSRKTQNKIMMGDKLIYSANTPNGWSIIIMPDNILIDNYHINKVHIHPKPEEHSCKVMLGKQNQNEIFEIIKEYINITHRFNIDELMELLK
ncbi:MAG: hypothetical protein IJF83_11815 [Methanobrevibacter sp.]|nr:hypothetical protein [Methanobrevibacter sp.]